MAAGRHFARLIVRPTIRTWRPTFVPTWVTPRPVGRWPQIRKLLPQLRINSLGDSGYYEFVWVVRREPKVGVRPGEMSVVGHQDFSNSFSLVDAFNHGSELQGVAPGLTGLVWASGLSGPNSSVRANSLPHGLRIGSATSRGRRVESEVGSHVLSWHNAGESEQGCQP